MNGLQTNGWAFLNLSNPITAWAAYRGCLVPVPQNKGFISIWHAARIRGGIKRTLQLENDLEEIRAEHFPDHISRLKGIFVFTDLLSAERATSWDGKHFNAEDLVELSLSEKTLSNPRMDANWITHSERDDLFPDWKYRYWSGEQYPNCEPIWEVLTDDKAWILGVEHRNRAYAIIKKHIPDSLCLLEIARLSAWIEVDIGNVSYFCCRREGRLIVSPVIDMSMANDEKVLQNITDLIDSGHPVNRSDIQRLNEGREIHTPDLSHLIFEISLDAN